MIVMWCVYEDSDDVIAYRCIFNNPKSIIYKLWLARKVIIFNITASFALQKTLQEYKMFEQIQRLDLLEQSTGALTIDEPLNQQKSE